jgi:V/A-type H+-transporting ATPase subunit A
MAHPCDRPVAERKAALDSFDHGQRVIDMLFPWQVRHGGYTRGFGTGKTMTQHAIARWCDADIIVYMDAVNGGTR